MTRTSPIEGQQATPDTTPTATPTEEALELRTDPDDIAHLVCCRDDEWRLGFCGAPGEYLNFATETVCTMCVEVAEQRLPGCFDNDPMRRPNGHLPCPDLTDVYLRAMDLTDGGAT